MHLSAEQDARYLLALKLVAQIERNLATGRCQYRDRYGRLLQDLGQVVVAIVTDNLQEAKPNDA